MKKVFASAIFITFVAIGITWAAIWSFARITYGFVPISVLMQSSLIAMLIAFPTGLLLEAQKMQLREASFRLRRSQARLCETMKELKRSSEIDCLTSVLNRGSFLRQLENLYEGGETGALLMIDADDFKSINDRFGHAAGDQALVLISNAISKWADEDSLVGRMGGEEFAVFLPSADRSLAKMTAERIRNAVNRTEFRPTENALHALSVSIGGEVLNGCNSFTEALAKADERMYQAKKVGKNSCQFPKADTLASFQLDTGSDRKSDGRRVA